MNDWTLYESIYVLAFLGGLTIISAIFCGAWELLKWVLDKAIETRQKPKKKHSRYTFIQQLMQDYNNYKACNDCVRRLKDERRGKL